MTAAMTKTLGVDNDRSAVLELDTRYQEAVKTNDIGIMHKLLADDFVLVTSSGKVFTKPDLLKEARSGTIHSEQQDDTDKTVRVWGDTAGNYGQAVGTRNGFRNTI